jgi:hypothetical protein
VMIAALAIAPVLSRSRRDRIIISPGGVVRFSG